MSALPTLRARGRRAGHLVGRFWGTLLARPLDDSARARVAAALEPQERSVWLGMSRADQAEGLGVARRLEGMLAGTAERDDPRWRAAALLHDAGKQLSGFSAPARAVVTVLAGVVGDERVRAWTDSPGRRRARVGRYVAHDDLGAALLRSAGARAEVAAWAGAHHHPARWPHTGIPPAVCRALAAADGEALGAGPDQE
jgi:hypothetical protein